MIYEKMADNGDGTYSYSYSVKLDGAITIIIKLVTANGVYGAWYGNTGWSGSPILVTTYPSLNFALGDVNWVNIPGGTDYKTAYFYSTLQAPALQS